MGRGWFIGTIVILSIITWVTAKFISDILHFFQFPPPEARAKRKSDLEKVPPNLWSWTKGILRETRLWSWFAGFSKKARTDDEEMLTSNGQAAQGKGSSSTAANGDTQQRSTHGNTHGSTHGSMHENTPAATNPANP